MERNERQVAYTPRAGRRAYAAAAYRRPRSRRLRHAGRSERGPRLDRGRLHRGDAHARLDADLRHAGEVGARSGPISRPAWAASAPAGSPTGRRTRTGTTGKPADPRSYCIQKTLQAIAHGGDVDRQPDVRRPQRLSLRQDPFYATASCRRVRQLVDRILTGDWTRLAERRDSRLSHGGHLRRASADNVCANSYSRWIVVAS